MSSPNRITRLILSTSAALLLFAASTLAAVTISVQANFSRTVGALDLSAGPGSDLTGSQESDPDLGAISIEGTTGGWRVDVKRTDASWDTDLELAIRRTSNGSGSGTISGGTSYLEVGAFDSTLFSGEADRADIDVQVRLSGLSAALGASSFSTTVTYTVVDQ